MSETNPVSDAASQPAPESAPAAAPAVAAAAAAAAKSPHQEFSRRRNRAGLTAMEKFMMVYWFIFNQFAFLNVFSASRLHRTGTCTVRGYPKFLFYWPLAPWGVYLSIVSWIWSDNTDVQHALGLWWVFILVITMLTVGLNVRNRTLGWALAMISVAALIGVVLQLGFQLQVTAWIRDFIEKFKIIFSPGIALFVAFVIGVVMLIFTIVSQVANNIVVKGNNYLPNRTMATEATVSHETHALRVQVDDWLERVLMSAVAVLLTSRYERGSIRDEGELHTARVEFPLENVPGGHTVKRIIDDELSAQDIEIPAQEN